MISAEYLLLTQRERVQLLGFIAVKWSVFGSSSCLTGAFHWKRVLESPKKGPQNCHSLHSQTLPTGTWGALGLRDTVREGIEKLKSITSNVCLSQSLCIRWLQQWWLQCVLNQIMWFSVFWLPLGQKNCRIVHQTGKHPSCLLQLVRIHTAWCL